MSPLKRVSRCKWTREDPFSKCPSCSPQWCERGASWRSDTISWREADHRRSVLRPDWPVTPCLSRTTSMTRDHGLCRRRADSSPISYGVRRNFDDFLFLSELRGNQNGLCPPFPWVLHVDTRHRNIIITGNTTTGFFAPLARGDQSFNRVTRPVPVPRLQLLPPCPPLSAVDHFHPFLSSPEPRRRPRRVPEGRSDRV